MRTRFAPSPTGLLHLGHAYAAKFAYDLARELGGEFLLRFEDIDHTRTRDQYYLEIERDLAWLLLDWDGTALRQTDRFSIYAKALEKLKLKEVVYPCFCTRREIQQEIAAIGGAPHIRQGNEGAPYPGICRSLSEQQRADKIAAGESHCWRLNSRTAAEKTGKLYFTDSIHGKIAVDENLFGDVILARKDISTSYHIAVVIDDAAQEITDVTRGQDLLNSTHVHRTLQKLLGLEAPHYHHHRLIKDSAQNRLAKRSSAMSLQSLREAGKTVEQVLAMILQ